IDAFVRALLRIGGPRADEPERPPLELIWVRAGEFCGVVKRDGFADDFVGLLDLRPVGVLESVLDEVDREVCDVDADPTTPQRLCRCDRGPAAAEGVKHRVSFVAARGDDSL